MTKEPERSIGRGGSSLIEDNGGIHNEFDEVLRKLRSGRRFSWHTVGWDTIRSVVLLAADEIEQPASMLSTPDFRKPFEALDGHNLTSLVHFSRTHPERGDENRIPFLLKKAGIEVTPEDILNRIRSGRKIYADRVTEDAMNGALHQVLPLMAEELQQPVSMLGVWDFTQKPLAALNGRTASGLYQHLIHAPDRKGQHVVNYILERAGIKLTAEDVITYIKTRTDNENEERRMYWDRIPGEEIGRLLKMATEELGLPTSMLKTEHLTRPLELLGGKTLGGLFEHHYAYVGRQDKDTVTSILEKAGISITSDDVVECIKSGHSVYWRRVPWEVIGEVLQKVADEVGIPLPLMDEKYLTRPLAIFKGHTIGGIRHLMIREGTGGMSSLTERAGKNTTAEDVIERMQSDQQIVWKRVPWEEIGKLIEIAADEIGVPISMLGRIDYIRALEVFNGHSLSGFYQYASREAKHQEKDPSVYILEQTGFDISTADVVSRIKEGRPVLWSRIPWEIITQLLHQVASEIDIPFKNIGSPDLTRPLPFLNEHSLVGLYGFCWAHPERNDKEVVTFLYEKTGITQTAEDVINQIKLGRPVFWYRVPEEEIKRIIQMTADDLGVSASMLAAGDIDRTPLSFLNGRKLGGLYGYMRRQLIGNDLGTRIETTEYMLQRLGFPATENDVIRNISQDRRVMWNRVPWEELGKLFHRVAQEFDLPAEMLQGEHLKQRLTFLNEHSLGGMYTWCLKQPEKGVYETTMAFIRRRLGLTEVGSLTRFYYRQRQVRESFNKFLSTNNGSVGIAVEEYLPWVDEIGHIYGSFAFGSNVDDIKSEAVIFIAERIEEEGAIRDYEGFITDFHDKLENIIRVSSSQHYRELSLSTPIHEELTLESVLEAKTEEGIEELDADLENKLKVLNPLQRKLVWAVAVEGRSLGELEVELGMDVDTLGEHYEDALTLLKETFEEN